jgi:hypothetical protein
MLFQNLSPSPALSITQFFDIDAFRPVEFVADARSVPLNLANFYTARAMVQLPFCQITVLTTFPRIVDVSYRAAHGIVANPGPCAHLAHLAARSICLMSYGKTPAAWLGRRPEAPVRNRTAAPTLSLADAPCGGAA